MSLYLIYDAITESGRQLPAGLTVEYRGHVPGGMIQVALSDDSLEIIHPATTRELG